MWGRPLTVRQVLKAIVTLPAHQKKGCASALIQSGLEIVDSRGAKAFLEAVPRGRSLYGKFGWKNVDEIIFDLSKYGGRSAQVTTGMLRAPRTA